MTIQQVFAADQARFDKAFRDAGAIFTTEDGLAWIDETKVPARLVRAYGTFCLYGFANGLM